MKKYIYPPLKILKYLLINKSKRTNLNNDFQLNDKEKLILNELKKNGYFVVQDFLEEKECKIIINEIEQTISKYPDKIWRDKKNSDNRILGAEKNSSRIFEYYDNNFIKKIGEAYCGFKLKNVMTMANKVKYFHDNEGSGGGWHKDSYAKQFKSMLYLNDVSNANGSFQLIKKSNFLINVIKTSIKLNKSYPDTRFTNEEIKNYFKENDVETLSGNAGTLIMFDPSLIHRGAPLISSQRYALTNYYDSVHNYENQMETIPYENRF